MDLNELKQDAEKLCKELKDKAPADLSILVLSLSTIIKMMIAMVSDVIEQNKKLTDSSSDLQETIKELQKTIKDLNRQASKDLHKISRSQSSDGYRKTRDKQKLNRENRKKES